MSRRSVPSDRGCVYFVQAGPDGPVKIGFSRTGSARVRDLQVASPHELRVIGLIAADSPAVERRMHRRFAADRIRGEWFRPDPELLEFVRQHAAVPDSPEWVPWKVPLPSVKVAPGDRRPARRPARRASRPKTPQEREALVRYLFSSRPFAPEAEPA